MRKRWDAVGFLKSGCYRDAFELAQCALRADPHDWYPHNLIGLIYRSVEDYPSAIEAYHNSLKLVPGNDVESHAHVSFNLGIVYQLSRQYPDSIHYLKAAIAEYPDIILAYNSLGCTYNAMGRYETALEVYDRGIVQHVDALYRGLLNSEDSPVFDFEETRGTLWVDKVIDVFVRHAASEGVTSLVLPSGDLAELEQRTHAHGGLCFVDEVYDGRTVRLLLTNYFNTMRKSLRLDVVYSTLLSNMGFSLSQLARRDEAVERLIESIEFIPPGTDFADPLYGLRALGVNV